MLEGNLSRYNLYSRVLQTLVRFGYQALYPCWRSRHTISFRRMSKPLVGTGLVETFSWCICLHNSASLSNDDQMLISWTLDLADQSVVYCSVGLGDDGNCKYVMHPGYEVGSYEERYNWLLCQDSLGMQQLEKSNAPLKVTYNSTFRGDEAHWGSRNQVTLDAETWLRGFWGARRLSSFDEVRIPLKIKNLLSCDGGYVRAGIPVEDWSWRGLRLQ